MKHKMLNYLLMLMNLALGICLLILASKIFEKLPTVQCNDELKTRVRVLLAFGCMLLSLAIAYFDCSKARFNMVLILSQLLVVASIILTVMIMNNIKEDPCTIDLENLDKVPTAIYVISVLSLLVAGGAVFLKTKTGKTRQEDLRLRAIRALQAGQR